MDAEPARVFDSSDGHVCAGGAHTRTDDGRLLCWQTSGLPRLRRAIDAELCDQEVPPALARRAPGLTRAEFWACWTRAEVRAKVRDIPIITWITTVAWQIDGDLDPAAEVITSRHGDLVVSYGVLGAPARPT